MRKETVLLEARFDPKLQSYWMFTIVLTLAVTIFGILLIPVWLAVGWGFHKKQFEAQTCTLTERSLNLKRGVIFKTEKNIPLDKIQDVGMREGPLLRKLGLSSIAIETAGQSAGPQGGADAGIVGIIDSPAFRDAILDQRDRIVHGETPVLAAPAAARSAETTVADDGGVLVEIRDSLQRIEQLIKDKQS
ncbi:MAG: hypothetical protein ACI8X5_003224 [Planctomycetota bacterium]|jgi:hypothetical protein